MTNPKKNLLITLGVRDIVKSRDFYTGLGFKVDEDNPNMVDFVMEGIRFSLYNIDKLANDINVYNPPKIINGFTGITLAYNLDSKELVDEMYLKVKKLGGTVEHPPEKAKDWEGYHFYFRDLDGYYWEIAY